MNLLNCHGEADEQTNQGTNLANETTMLPINLIRNPPGTRWEWGGGHARRERAANLVCKKERKGPFIFYEGGGLVGFGKHHLKIA